MLLFDLKRIFPLFYWYVIISKIGSMWASTPTNTDVRENAQIRPKSRIASIVRSIKTLSAKEIGAPVFQSSYYDHVIRNQQDDNAVWE